MYFQAQLFLLVSLRKNPSVIELFSDFIGMAKAVADSRNINDGQGGFTSDDSPILGFSHMHDSGTGGVRLNFF